MPEVNALLLPLLMGLSFAGYAQVYKSIDADGNVVYSDTPPATGGEEIQVPEANVADPVEVPVNVSPEPEPAPEPEVVEEQPQPEISATSDDDDDDGLNARQKLRRAKRIRNNKR